MTAPIVDVEIMLASVFGGEGVSPAEKAEMNARLARLETRVIDPRQYDIMPGGADVSAQMNAMFADLRAAVSATDTLHIVDFPRGIYAFHEVDASGTQVLLRSGGSRSARFVYNGSGGAGSHLLNMGQMSFGGIEGIALDGVNPAYTTICETLLKLAFVDNQSVWRDLQFYACTGDAIQLSGQFFNWHLDRVRFDSVGGWAINVMGSPPQYAPLTLGQWTWDNAIRNELKTFLVSSGRYAAGRWGKGVLRLQDGGPASIQAENGRIELNEPAVLTNNRVVIFQSASGGGMWSFATIVGYNATNDPAVLLSVAHQNAMTSFVNTDFDGRYLEQSDVPDWRPHNLNYLPGATVLRNGNYQNQQGVVIGGQLIESRSTAGGYPWSQVYGLHRRGDIIFDQDATPGLTGVGFFIDAPSGYGQFAGSTITTTAVVTAGSTTVNMANTGAALKKALPGTAVRIVGAGPGGADLLTTITNVNATNRTITLATTPGTTRNPATILYQVPERRDFGDIATYGTAAPTSGTWRVGEKRWNTAPAQGQPIGWVCVTAGTPGIWRPFGTIG